VGENFILLFVSAVCLWLWYILVSPICLFLLQYAENPVQGMTIAFAAGFFLTFFWGAQMIFLNCKESKTIAFDGQVVQ
jgi:hypothetical protein